MDGSPRDYRVAVVDRIIPTEFDQELASANLGLLWGWNDVIVPSGLRLVRNDAYLAYVGLDIGEREGRVKVDRLLDHLPLASALGVRYLLSIHRIEDSRLRLLQERPVRVYENTEALPLAYLVGCVRWQPIPSLHSRPSTAYEPITKLPLSLATYRSPRNSQPVELDSKGTPRSGSMMPAAGRWPWILRGTLCLWWPSPIIRVGKLPWMDSRRPSSRRTSS